MVSTHSFNVNTKNKYKVLIKQFKKFQISTITCLVTKKSLWATPQKKPTVKHMTDIISILFTMKNINH